MFKVTNGLILVTFMVISGAFTTVYTVDVRLKDGQSANQGRVEVRRNEGELWGKVCDINFDDEAAAVVCRQLNYKFSRNDRDAYIPDYPDYRLENIHCHGNESKLDECIDGDWVTNTGICNHKINAYASVCCSNSPIFGEMRDGLFVSHCADSWVEAEERCEEKNATLASVKEYTTILGSTPKDSVNGNEGQGYWTNKFYTPWIWSNGCFEFKNDSFDHEEFNLQNNSAQACLQMCSLDSRPSAFLLSESFCRCIPKESMESYVIEVLPGWCNRKCKGDNTYFCGSTSRSYWSLYTIAAESIFFKISDPTIYEHRQCAVLEASRKLSSEDCSKRYGYICGQILTKNSTMPKLMFFQNSRFYELYMLEARQKCTNDDTTMRIIGERIMEQDTFSQKYFHLWVDISRLLTHVYVIQWQPQNRKGLSQWRNLEPHWCFARHTRGKYYSDEVTECNARFRYICSTDNIMGDASGVNGSSEEGDGDSGTGYTQTFSITEVQGHPNTTEQVYHDHETQRRSMGIMIAVAICGISILLIIALIFLYRRSKGHLKGILCWKSQPKAEHLATGDNYDATFDACNAYPEHIYDEIRSENIYHEADTLLDDRNSCPVEDKNNIPMCSQTEKDPLTVNPCESNSKSDVNKDLKVIGDVDETHTYYTLDTGERSDIKEDSPHNEKNTESLNVDIPSEKHTSV